MDIHYWRNNAQRPAFFRSATFVCTWNGLRKSVRRGMDKCGIESIKIVREGGDRHGKADIRTPV